MPTLDTTTIPKHDASNTRIRKFVIYSGPASYATGGDSLTAASLGLGRLHMVIPTTATDGTDLRLLNYDHTAQAMKWFDLAGAEIAALTDLSTYSARLEIVGL